MRRARATRFRIVLALVASIAALPACRGVREDPILELSSAEALEEGRKLMAEGKFNPARRYFVHAFEVEPNSVTGREGLLLAADAYFKAGGEDNLIKAEARYRDFVNRFPTSEHAAYAQFQIGLSLSRRIVKPDRDQAVSKQALSALEDVQRFYPTSTFAAQAAQEVERVRGHLAEHDFLVGRFYRRFGLPYSAIERYEYLLETYPEYAAKDKVLYHLCEAYLARRGEGDVQKAREACGRLGSEFPESEYVAKIPKQWPEEKPKPAEPSVEPTAAGSPPAADDDEESETTRAGSDGDTAPPPAADDGV
jgi:outer membrane protein assembly factor BamD